MSAVAETLDQDAEQIAHDIGIPPCPAILTRLVRETRSDEPDFRRVGQLIGSDVALAATMLKIANSPFYGLRTKASTVQHALALLGLSTVTQVVTGLLLRQAFPGGSGAGMERFWKSSMATGLIASLLARETRRADDGLAHTFGLFRDCGMPLMMQKFPIYGDILDGSALAAGDPILEIEGERYAMNHCRVGARLAQSWHLEEMPCFAILHHHDLCTWFDDRTEQMPEARELVSLGLVAEHLYCRATGQICREWDSCGEIAAALLGLSSLKLDDLAARVKASLGSA